MLHIFGRDAWRPLGKHGPATLNLNLTTSATRVRVVANWADPGPKEIDARCCCKEYGSNEPRTLSFYPCDKGLFTRWEAPKSGDFAIELSSPNPPNQLAFSEAGPAVSITGGVLPACLEVRMPQHRGEPVGFDLAWLVAERLGNADLAGAIKLFTYAHSGVPEAEVVAAARQVLAHLARYPLQRDPLLGAFLASLCAEAPRR